MKQSTKYQYEKRIKELQDRLDEKESALYEYKQLCLTIFNDVTGMVKDNKQISQGYLLSLFKRLFL